MAWKHFSGYNNAIVNEKDAMPVNTKTPAHIFNTMALTIADPTNLEAYRGSCYHVVASAIAANEVEPNQEIVMVGLSGNVFHVFIAEGERLVVDSMRTPGGIEPQFNTATGEYTGPFNKRPETVQTVARITVADFKRKYVDPLKP
jgi:hypothetical protein